MTNCEATALLWRVLLYLHSMAYRQREDQQRRDYLTAAKVVSTAHSSIDWSF
jgi:hypothetical protein